MTELLVVEGWGDGLFDGCGTCWRAYQWMGFVLTGFSVHGMCADVFLGSWWVCSVCKRLDTRRVKARPFYQLLRVHIVTATVTGFQSILSLSGICLPLGCLYFLRTRSYLRFLHGRFCSFLAETLLIVRNELLWQECFRLLWVVTGTVAASLQITYCALPVDATIDDSFDDMPCWLLFFLLVEALCSRRAARSASSCAVRNGLSFAGVVSAYFIYWRRQYLRLLGHSFILRRKPIAAVYFIWVLNKLMSRLC